MKPDRSFPFWVKVMEKKRKRRRAFSFFLLFLSLLLMGEVWVLLRGKGLPLLPGGLLAGFLLSAWAAAFRTDLRKNRELFSELQHADARLKLNDRLATAYEYFIRQKSSALREHLLEDAAGIVEERSLKRIFPVYLPVSFGLVGLLSAMVLLLPHLELAPLHLPKEKTKAPPPPLAALLQEFSRKQIPPAGKAEETSREEPNRELKALAQTLREGSSSREKMLQIIGEMKTEIRERRARLSRNLAESLQIGPGTEAATDPLLPPFPTHPQAWERWEEALKDLFGGNLPQPLARDLALLREDFDLEKFLDQTLGLILSPDPGVGRDTLPALEKRGKPTGGKKEEKTEGPFFGSTPPFSAENGRKNDIGSSDVGSGKQDSQEKKANGSGQGKEGLFTAGSGKGDGGKLRPSDFQRSKGPVFREKGFPMGPGPTPSLTVRGRPLSGDSETVREQVIGKVLTSSSREKEAVIGRENIPGDYRKVIRHYFLTIKEERGVRQHEQSR